MDESQSASDHQSTGSSASSEDIISHSTSFILLKFLKAIRIEVVFLCYILPSYLSDRPLTTIIFKEVCQNNNTSRLCHHTKPTNYDHNKEELLLHSNQLVVDTSSSDISDIFGDSPHSILSFETVTNIIGLILVIVYSYLLSQRRAGHRKLILLLPLFGKIISTLNLLAHVLAHNFIESQRIEEQQADDESVIKKMALLSMDTLVKLDQSIDALTGGLTLMIIAVILILAMNVKDGYSVISYSVRRFMWFAGFLVVIRIVVSPFSDNFIEVLGYTSEYNSC